MNLFFILIGLVKSKDLRQKHSFVGNPKEAFVLQLHDQCFKGSNCMAFVDMIFVVDNYTSLQQN